MLAVLINGKQGSGKSTLVDGLQQYLITEGLIPLRDRFAEVIYQMHNACRVVMGQNGIAPRGEKDGDLLQLLGTEYGRKFLGDNVWVNALRHRINNIDTMLNNNAKDNPSLNQYKRVVLVDDLRFKNEFDSFSDGLKIRLECPKELRKKRAVMWRERDTHQSEIDLDDYAAQGKFDLTINTESRSIMETLSFTIHTIKKRMDDTCKNTSGPSE